MDQVLAYHRVSPRKFELSGLRTGSVRDQMLRSKLVTEALSANGIAASGDRLLIIGGGVAGVTCALTAAAMGINVDLLELNKRHLFSAQRGTASRRLDPSEFDWPHPHWNSGKAPWKPSALPLSYPPGQASRLARAWDRGFHQWLRQQSTNPTSHLGRVTCYWGVDGRQLTCRDQSNAVVVTGPGIASPQVYAAAISCVGFSGEIVAVPSTTHSGHRYHGYEFWSTDLIEQPRCGLNKPMINILVSGGGDGAQQDFLRVLTGSFGVELYEKLGLPAPCDLSLLPLVLAEDEALRAYAWKNRSQTLTETNRHWNREYHHLVNSVWDKWSLRQRTQLARSVLREGVNATWVIGGEGPGYCYGLNRFLSLLVAKLHAETEGRPYETQIIGGRAELPRDEVVVRGHRLTGVGAVASSTHACQGISTCFGLLHTATVTSASYTSHVLGDFDLIILRHGVKTQPMFGSPPVSQQILPMRPPA